jgi:hypothetical protein
MKNKKRIRKTITLTPKIAKKADAQAKEENRTVSNFIENVLDEHFQKKEG